MADKIFFSYSRLDSAFALRLANDLRELGADLWIDQLDISAGTHWDAAVEKALSSSICVLVILSPSSTSSTNVMDEVSFALETGKKIIPVLLEDCPPPFRLRRLQRIDFTKNYEAGFAQLLHSFDLPTKQDKKTNEKVNPGAPAGVAQENAAAVSDEAEIEELNLWEEACRQHSRESYERYMVKSVLGAHRIEARLMIKQLELEEKEGELETLLWQKAQSEHSPNLYRHYLEEYPDGDYKTLALAAIADLEKQDKKEKKDHAHEAKISKKSAAPPKPNPLLDQKRIIFGAIGILVLFIFVFALSTRNNNKDKDQLAWQTASFKKDSTSIAAYMHSFPKGKYYTQAKLKLDSIRAHQQHLQDSIATASLIPEIIPDTTKAKTPPPASNLTKPKPKVTPQVKPVSKYAIGQKLFGGIVASIDATGNHGLIIAEKDFIGVDWETAKKKCESSKTNGYSDWRLPTKDELNKIYQNRNKTGAFSKVNYWSSAEVGPDMAWTQNLVDGKVIKFNKKMSWYARAVRPF